MRFFKYVFDGGTIQVRTQQHDAPGTSRSRLVQTAPRRSRSFFLNFHHHLVIFHVRVASIWHRSTMDRRRGQAPDRGRGKPWTRHREMENHSRSCTRPNEQSVSQGILHFHLQANPLLLNSWPTLPHFPPNCSYTANKARSSSSFQSSLRKLGSRASRYLFEHASSVRPGICLAMSAQRV